MKKISALLVIFTLAFLCVILLPARAQAASDPVAIADPGDLASARSSDLPHRAAPVQASDLVFLQNPSLSFQDYIGMQVMISSQLRNTYDEIYVAAIQQDPVNGGTTTTWLEGMLYYYDLLLVFDQQILSWSMTEKVNLTLYAVKNGTTYIGQSYTVSVESLALGMLEKNASDPKVCRVLVDMLNYGAAVQKQFSYNTGSLPNRKLGQYASMGTQDTPKMTADNISRDSGSVQILQISVSLQSKIEVQILFNQRITGYWVRAWIGDELLDAVVDTKTLGDAGYTVVRMAIGADQMRDPITFALFGYDGYPVTSIETVSVESLVKDKIQSSPAILAMMRYGDAVAGLADQSESSTADLAAKIIGSAMEHLGVQYVYGGITPDGFDCSGYMLYCFDEHDIYLPRVSRDQAVYGEKISQSELKPGDLIFFDTKGDGVVNHVGLYIGDGEFVHASTKRGMEIAYLYDGYWNWHYLGGRRVL